MQYAVCVPRTIGMERGMDGGWTDGGREGGTEEE